MTSTDVIRINSGILNENSHAIRRKEGVLSCIIIFLCKILSNTDMFYFYRLRVMYNGAATNWSRQETTADVAFILSQRTAFELSDSESGSDTSGGSDQWSD